MNRTRRPTGRNSVGSWVSRTSGFAIPAPWPGPAANALSFDQAISRLLEELLSDIRAVVREELLAHSSSDDALFDDTAAAKLLNQTPGPAWRMFVKRHPDLRALAIKFGARNRRWRRADLEAWIAGRGRGSASTEVRKP